MINDMVYLQLDRLEFYNTKNKRTNSFGTKQILFLLDLDSTNTNWQLNTRQMETLSLSIESANINMLYWRRNDSIYIL